MKKNISVTTVFLLLLLIAFSCAEKSKTSDKKKIRDNSELKTSTKNEAANGIVFEESDGVILFEAESIPLSEGWVNGDDHQGFSGDGYITWADSTTVEKNNQGLLPYKIKISKPGIYTLKLRNFHDCEDFTECNDVFVKMNDGEWQKNFNHNVDSWDWTSQQDIEHVFSDSKFDLSSGIHTLYLSGRSKDFSIDRIVLYHEDTENRNFHSTKNSTILR